MPVEIRRSLSVIAVLVPAFAAPCALAGPSDLDLACSGNSYSKAGDPFPTPETVSLKKVDAAHVLIGLPGSDKPTNARIVSSNAIQLKFAASGFIGEYFNFSGDLFLIHKDGRLTRLTCKPNA